MFAESVGSGCKMVVQLIIIVLLFRMVILFFGMLGRRFRARDMPRIGGRLGSVRAIDPPQPPLSGFSRIYARAMTVFAASEPTSVARFSTLDAFLRDGTLRRPVVMRIYRVAGCKAEIEISDQPADYERIDAVEALELLRELPDPRLVRRLHLSDEPSFVDPWLRKVNGAQFFVMGHANRHCLIVLYRPDRGHRELVRITLLHEWLHLVAYASAPVMRRFKQANAIEPMPPLTVEPLSRELRVHEDWCYLGEDLIGYDEAAARRTALAFPVHAMILWRCVELMLRRTPLRLRSTRFDELTARGDFMHAEVDPKARAARGRSVFLPAFR